MIPTDPKKAQQLGQEWGQVITDSVFGIVDTVNHAKAVKEHNKATIEHNKGVSTQNKILKDIAMKEMAREQEQAMLDKLSPAQKDAYYKAKIAAGKEAKRLQLEEEAAREERNALLAVISIVFIILPMIIWIFAIITVGAFSTSDRYSYRQMAPYIPFAQKMFGKV